MKKKQSYPILWTLYHTAIVVELFIIIVLLID